MSQAKEQSEPAFKVVSESESQSYVWIYKHGTAWMGNVERTIAIEIVSEMNTLHKARKRIEELEAALKDIWIIAKCGYYHNYPNGGNDELYAKLQNAKKLIEP